MASGTGRITPADVPQDVLRGKPLLEGFVEKQERSFLKRYARRYFVLFGGSAPLLCYFGNRDQPNDLRGAFDLRRLRAVEAQGAELVLVIGEEHLRLRAASAPDAERWRRQLAAVSATSSVPAGGASALGSSRESSGTATDENQSRERKRSVQLAFSRGRGLNADPRSSIASSSTPTSARHDAGTNGNEHGQGIAPRIPAQGHNFADGDASLPQLPSFAANVNVLQQFLQTHGISTIRYGRGKAKSLAHLLKEITGGETILRVVDNGTDLERVVHVAEARVYRPEAPDRFLLETHQLFDGGRVRFRNVLLSEKFKPGEDAIAAAVRGVREELCGLQASKAVDEPVAPKQIVPQRHTLKPPREVVLESPSYPGLRTRYFIHRVDVAVSPLDSASFMTNEYRDDGSIKQQHFWKWHREAEIEGILGVNERQRQRDRGGRAAAASWLQALSPSQDTQAGSIEQYSLFDLSPDHVDDTSGTCHISLNALKKALRRWGLEKEEQKQLLALCTVVDGVTAPVTAMTAAALQQHFPIVRTASPLILSAEDRQLVKCLFNHATVVSVSLLHGGFSGSFVLQAQASTGTVDNVSAAEASSVLKIDDVVDIADERDRMRQICPMLGENTVKVIGHAEIGNRAAIKMDLAGGSWLLPELAGVTSASLVCTLADSWHEHLQLIKGEDDNKKGDGDARMYGEVTSNLTNTRRAFGDPAAIVRELFLVIMSKPTVTERHLERLNLYLHYDIKSRVERHVLQIEDDKARELESLSPGVRAYFARFVERMQAEQLCGDDLSEHLVGLVHGDLNARNVLVDSGDVVWIVDFAFSGERHVLTDIAKLECSLLYEYGLATSLQEPAGSEWDMALSIAQALAQDTLLPSKPAGLSAHWEALFVTLDTLRHCAIEMLSDAPPKIASAAVLEYSFPLLRNALHALKFSGFSRAQRALALFVARLHAARIEASLDPKTSRVCWPQKSVATDLQPQSLIAAADDERELNRYCHCLQIHHGHMIDAISREPLNIMEQCVSLKVLQGEDKADCIHKAEEVDAAMERHMAARRLNEPYYMLRGHARETTPGRGRVRRGGIDGDDTVADDDASQIDALKRLLPGADNSEYKQVVLLGAAASGKSVLLKKTLVVLAQSARGASGFVPILILLIDLGRMMVQHGLGPTDLLVERYLEETWGARSPRCASLCRAFHARRTLLLLDGLDEAGTQKDAVEQYIRRLVRDGHRVVVSSRHTGFKDEVFSGFDFIQVCPLSRAMQHEVVDRRLVKHSSTVIEGVKAELGRPQYAEMAQNPLMLSLLVNVLGHRILAADAVQQQLQYQQQPITRAQLYAAAIKLVLHKTADDKHKTAALRHEHDLDSHEQLSALATPACMTLLETLAFATHRRGKRDITSRELVDSVDGAAAAGAASAPKIPAMTAADRFHAEQAWQESLAESCNVLQHFSRQGQLPLFVVLEEKYGAKAVSSTRIAKRGSFAQTSSTFDQVMRFSHLTFQEFLAARYIASKLQNAVIGAGTDEEAQITAIRVALSELAGSVADTSKDTQQRVPTHDMLLDPWWKQTLLFVGGTLVEQAWEPLAMALLQEDDASGALSVLLQQMLAENPEVALAIKNSAALGNSIGERDSDRNSMDLDDASGRVRRSGVRRALRMVRERISALRPIPLLCAGLCHPSSQLRSLAISEMVEFNVPCLSVAEALVRRLGFQPRDQEATQKERPLSWFEYRNAVVSIGMLEQASSTITSALLKLWRSRGDRHFGRLLAPDGANLGPATAQLRNSALQTLGALGAWNDPDVQESLRAACGIDSDSSSAQYDAVSETELARALYDARVLCTVDPIVLNLCANILQQDEQSKLSSRAFLLLCDAAASLPEHTESFCGAMVDPWFIKCLAIALPPPPITGSSDNQASAATAALAAAEARYNTEERDCAAAAVQGLSQALCASTTSVESRKQIISALLPVFHLREDQGLGILAAILSILRGRVICSMDGDHSQRRTENVARMAAQEVLHTLGPPFNALCNIGSDASVDDIDNAACIVVDSLLQKQALQLEQEGAQVRSQESDAQERTHRKVMRQLESADTATLRTEQVDKEDDTQRPRVKPGTPKTSNTATFAVAQEEFGTQSTAMLASNDNDSRLMSVHGVDTANFAVTLEDALDEVELPPLSTVPAAEQISKLLRQQHAASDTAKSQQENDSGMRRRLNKLAHVRAQLATAAKLSTLLLPATETQVRVAAACRLALHCDEITTTLLGMMSLSATQTSPGVTTAPGIDTNNLVTSMACEVDKFVLVAVLKAIEHCTFRRDDALARWLVKSLLPLSKLRQCTCTQYVPSDALLDPAQPATCLRNALRHVASVSVDSDVLDANSLLRSVARITASMSLVEVDAFNECVRVVELGGQDSAHQRRMGQALYEELVSDELELQPAASPTLLIHALTPYPKLLGPRQKDTNAAGVLEQQNASFAFAPLLRWVRARREAEPRWSLRVTHPALEKRLRLFVRTNPNMSVGALHLLKELCVGRFEIELGHYDDDIEPEERESSTAEVHPLNHRLFDALTNKNIDAVQDVIDSCDGKFDTALFVDDENNQPLHVAARFGFVSAIDAILAAGHGQLEAIGFDGYHPLHFAAEYNMGDAVQRLIDHGAIVDSANSFDNTPLHFAARGGYDNIVSLLLDSGADPRITNRGGKTALSLARQRARSGQKNDGSGSVALLARALSRLTLTCPGKHGLKACLWDSDHSTQLCDKCNSIIETSQSMFSCRTCDFDLCNSCYSRNASELATQSERMPCPVCQDNDLLVFTPSSQRGNEGTTYYCDTCGRKQDAGAELHSCRRCNFDLCRDCYDAEKTDFAPIDQLSAVLRNDEGRNVRLGRNLDYSDQFYCNARLRELEANAGCNGVCGPSNGPQCASCARFQSENRHLVMQLNVRFEDTDGGRVVILLNDQLGVDCYKDGKLYKRGIEDSVSIREGMIFMPNHELLLDAGIPNRVGQCTMRRLLALFHSTNPNKKLDQRMLTDPATQKKLDEDLFMSVYAGRHADVERLLDDGADPSAHKDTTTGKRALHLCTDAAMTRLLIGRGNTALLDAKDGIGMTALHIACRNGRTDIVEILLANGADVTHVSDDSQTPLHFAASSGSVEVLQALLDKGLPASLVDASGRTPLDIATDAGKHDAMKLLEGMQSIPQAEALSFLSRATQALSTCEQSAFVELAALEKPPELALKVMQLIYILLGYEHLPEGDWSVAQQQLHDRRKLLHDVSAFNPLAVSDRARDDAENVLQFCAPVSDVETEAGKALATWAMAATLSATALHRQREANRQRKMPLELQRGLNARLHESAAKGDVPQVSSLLVQGASSEWINADEFGQRALHRAAYNGHVTVVKMLLAQGANAESVNSNGIRALHMAASRGHNDVLSVLLDHGADPRALSKRNRTALDFARQHGHTPAVELLQNNMQQKQRERVARHNLAAHLTKAQTDRREMAAQVKSASEQASKVPREQEDEKEPVDQRSNGARASASK